MRVLQPTELLDLHDRGLTPGAGALLAAFPGLRGVAILRLGANALDATDMAALARSSHVDQLRHLDLQGNPLGDDGLQALAHRGWRNLWALDVSGTGAGPAGLRALLDMLPRAALLRVDHVDDPVLDELDTAFSLALRRP